MIIWFGSTEIEQQKMVWQKFFDIVSKYIKKWDDEYDFDKFYLDKIETEVKEFEKEIEEKYDIQDKQEKRPERYFKFRIISIAQNYETIFICVKFWHINSQHPFSPDWMALMEEFKTFSYNYDSYNWLRDF
jgi:hypothetical protein